MSDLLRASRLPVDKAVKQPFDKEAAWPEAGRSMLAVALATTAFAVWHSLLCSDGAKEFAREKLGKQRGTGLYRAFFMGQSVVTAGALFAFILRQPYRVLYRGRSGVKWLGWAAQAASIGAALWAFSDLDKAKFLGIKGVRSLEEEHTVEAEAQGPELDESGEVQAVGLYRYSRHPMEWAPVALLLSSPVMKTNWLAFDLLAALYSLVGALHEEKRLLRKGGASYARYQKQVPFFFGKPTTKASD